MPVIKAKNFTLRPFRIDDSKDLARCLNHKVFSKGITTIPYPYTTRHAREWLSMIVPENNINNPEEYNFAIEIDGRANGCISFDKISRGHEAAISYWLAREYWGSGIMQKAIKKASAYVMRRFGLVRLYALVHPNNENSIKLLRMLGYSFEGTLRKGGIKRGRAADLHLYARVK